MQNDNNQNPNSNAANNVVDSFFGPSDFDGEAPLGGEQKKKFKNHRRNLERQNAAAKAKAAAKNARENKAGAEQNKRWEYCSKHSKYRAKSSQS